MSLRIFSVGISLIVAACGGPPEGVTPGNVQEVVSGAPAEAPAEHIACAIGGGDYADVCTIDRTRTADGALLTIRHPDGGFRRLRVSGDGKTIAAADGAALAQVIGRGEAGIEIAIGDARYRLPLR